MPEELVTLHSAGALPGIPGEHAVGSYWVDYGARTIRPAQPLDTQPEPLQGDLQAGDAGVAQEITHLQEEVQQLEAEQRPQA